MAIPTASKSENVFTLSLFVVQREYDTERRIVFVHSMHRWTFASIKCSCEAKGSCGASLMHGTNETDLRTIRVTIETVRLFDSFGCIRYIWRDPTIPSKSPTTSTGGRPMLHLGNMSLGDVVCAGSNGIDHSSPPTRQLEDTIQHHSCKSQWSTSSNCRIWVKALLVDIQQWENLLVGICQKQRTPIQPRKKLKSMGSDRQHWFLSSWNNWMRTISVPYVDSIRIDFIVT